MGKSITFELGEFKRGYFMAWTASTQCLNTVNVQLKAGNKTYLNASKNDRTTSFKLLSQGNDDFGDEGILCLTITSNEANRDLKSSIVSGAIVDARAKKVGYTYSFCIEDQDDDDYNDVYFNIVAWERKG